MPVIRHQFRPALPGRVWSVVSDVVAHGLPADYDNAGIARFGGVRGGLGSCVDIAVDKFEDDNASTPVQELC